MSRALGSDLLIAFGWCFPFAMTFYGTSHHFINLHGYGGHWIWLSFAAMLPCCLTGVRRLRNELPAMKGFRFIVHGLAYVVGSVGLVLSGAFVVLGFPATIMSLWG